MLSKIEKRAMGRQMEEAKVKECERDLPVRDGGGRKYDDRRQRWFEESQTHSCS